MTSHKITTIKTMILTESNLHALGSYNGVGWNKKQLTQLGISWPPPSGWLKKLVGTEIDTNKYEMAMSLRNIKDNQYKSKEGAKEHKLDIQHTVSVLVEENAALRKELLSAQTEIERLHKAGRDTWSELRQRIHQKDSEIRALIEVYTKN